MPTSCASACLCAENARTAALLTTLILHRSGYGLKGIHSLEEHYAQDLQGYYDALAVGPSDNYYLDGVEAEITGFLEYFCRSMADTVAAVRAQATRAASRAEQDTSPLLRQLEPRQRRALELYRDQAIASAAELAAHLGLSPRAVTSLCRRWVAEGFLQPHDVSRKGRSYRLAPAYERLVAPD